MGKSRNNSQANKIATVAAQYFMDYVSDAAGININITHNPTQQKSHLHLEIAKPNELTKDFLSLIELLSEHLQLSLHTLDPEHQQLTQLIEAGFIYGLLSIIEQNLNSNSQSHRLANLKSEKDKIKRLIDALLKQEEYKELLTTYNDIPKVTELFLETYLNHVSMPGHINSGNTPKQP